ncbi:MAG: leucine-rich repeat domain-containing protein [Paludibacteraceae bacterium]|nr:leucine-rich repeat domain-containing protein [Paludibacteraceae bacterium]
MKRLLTLSLMLTLCLLTFATDFMHVKLKDGNIVRYEVDSIEEVYFEIGEDTSIIGDTTAVDTFDSALRFRITSDSTAEVSGYRNYYNNTDSIAIPEKVRINGKIYNVTSIGDGVFGGYSGLTSIRIPESVTSIGAEAFIGCSDLIRINIPESVSSIGDKAFKDCTNLDVTIDNSKENVTVGSDVFNDCKSVKWLKEKD